MRENRKSLWFRATAIDGSRVLGPYYAKIPFFVCFTHSLYSTPCLSSNKRMSNESYINQWNRVINKKERAAVWVPTLQKQRERKREKEKGISVTITKKSKLRKSKTAAFNVKIIIASFLWKWKAKSGGLVKKEIQTWLDLTVKVVWFRCLYNASIVHWEVWLVFSYFLSERQL